MKPKESQACGDKLATVTNTPETAAKGERLFKSRLDSARAGLSVLVCCLHVWLKEKQY